MQHGATKSHKKGTKTSTPSDKDEKKTVGAIRRSLLTPCRRVGLSARKKTSKATTEEAQTPSIKVKRERKRIKIEDTFEKKENVHASTESVVTVDGVSSKEERTSKDVQCCATVNVFTRIENTIGSQDTVTDVQRLLEESTAANDDVKSTPSGKSFVQRQPTIGSQNDDSQNTDASFVSTQSTASKRRLATKQTVDSQDTVTDSDVDDDFDCATDFKRIKHDSTMSVEDGDCFVHVDGIDECVYVPDGADRSLVPRPLPSDDEDDFVSSGSSTKRRIDDLKRKIASLKDDIRLNRRKADDLKRTEINRNRHGLKDLDALTLRWKRGCQNALTDLLTAVRRNDDTVDMVALLKEMNIAHSFICYDSDENCFT